VHQERCLREHLFDNLGAVDRRYELELMRRSLAMLTPGVQALTREEALRLVEELVQLQAHLDRLRDGLRRLIADMD
jgi:hypothetical protein